MPQRTPEPSEPGRRDRRALTHVGGVAELVGDRELAALLGLSLDVQSGGEREGEGATRAHVHGFHAYPARMHPDTARRLIEALSREGDTVLDPFCGSGTVVVEAALAKRRAIGTDLNPLAVRLARLKITPASAAHRAALLAGATHAADVALARKKARAGASRRYPAVDVELFDPHVLLELDSLRLGVNEVLDDAVVADLALVFSSILVKFSRKASDTAGHLEQRRIAAGFPSKSFVRKTEELTRALAEVAPELAAAPRAIVSEDDARSLATVEAGSVDLIVTSPPYAGVYDYLGHHLARLRWLGLDTRGLEAGEIGARRTIARASPAEGRAKFEEEMRQVLVAMARVLRPGGRAALLIADGLSGKEPIRAEAWIRDLSPAAGLSLLAMASQARPHFHGPTAGAFAHKPRREHAILLERVTPRAADRRPSTAESRNRARRIVR